LAYSNTVQHNFFYNFEVAYFLGHPVYLFYLSTWCCSELISCWFDQRDDYSRDCSFDGSRLWFSHWRRCWHSQVCWHPYDA